MTKPVNNVAIVAATKEDLEAYATSVRDNTTTAKDFCEYLKTKAPNAQEVIADISGVVFSDLDLKNIDLGNVIACKQNNVPTQFRNCNLEGTTFRSNASMEGLEFTNCTKMANASFAASLDGVIFGKNSDISGINLQEASNIDKCIIHPTCAAKDVKLGFPDIETFNHYTHQQVEATKEMNQAETHVVDPTYEPVPKLTLWQTVRDLNPGPFIRNLIREVTDGEGVNLAPKAIAKNVASAAGVVVSQYTTTVVEGITAAADFVTRENMVGRDTGPSQTELRENAITTIRRSNPQFSTTLKNIDRSDIVNVTVDEVKEWADANKAERGGVSLSEFIGSETVPHLQNLDLSGIDFSGLKFGDVVVSKCNFSNAKFNTDALSQKCDLDNVSMRDCNFTKAEFSGTSATKADFTRCTLDGAKISSNANFEGSTLTNATLNDVTISDTNLNKVDMKGAILHRAVITNTTLDGANLQEAKGETVRMMNVKAKSTNLTSSEFIRATIEDSTLDNCVAHNAKLTGSILTDVKLTALVGHKMDLAKCTLSDVDISNSDLSHNVMTESKISNVNIASSNITKLEAFGIIADKLNMSDIVNSPGINISGGKFANTTFTNVNMPHAKMNDIEMIDSQITTSTLHAADFSGTATKFTNTILDRVDLTNSKMDSISMSGGTIKNTIINGISAKEAKFGTNDSKISIENVKADLATNFANSSFKPTKYTTIAVDTFHGGHDNINVQDLPKKHEQQASITNSLSNLRTSITSAGSEILAGASTVVSGAADSLRTYKKSRLGIALGVLTGIVAGGAIAAMAASTFGLGLIPLAVVAGVAVGAGAIGGGIAGNMIQHTNTGRGILTMATASVAAMALGPVGLVAAPAMMVYNVVAGHKSPIKSAIGSVMDTFIAKPLSKISGFISDLVPSQKEVKEAQRANQMRDEVSAKVSEEAAEITKIAPDKHKQAAAVAVQVTANEQTQAPTQEKTNWRSKIVSKVKHAAHTVAEKVTRKKSSHLESVTEQAANASASRYRGTS